jgi:hypothetical protein
MVWSDSYQNTGMWIGSSYVAIASLAGGKAWYCASTLCWDRREWELHIWDGARLNGSNRLARPDSMTLLDLPRGQDTSLRGVDGISGATYDSVGGRLYLINFLYGAWPYAGRLYSFRVEPGAGRTTQTTVPTGRREPMDVEAPLVSIVSPASRAILSGEATLRIASKDNVEVASVDLLHDGVVVATFSSPPPLLELPADTRQTPNGTYVISARAYDTAGNAATSAPVTVIVRNAPER